MTWPHGGLGTEESPYLVPDADALDDSRSFTGDGVFFGLTANIDLDSYSNWSPIANPAGCTYDFDGYYVDNLKITGTATDKGLFSNNYGTLTDPNILRANVSGGSRTSALCAWNRSTGVITRPRVGRLSNQSNIVVTSTADHSGPVFGINDGGTITEGFACAQSTTSGTSSFHQPGGFGGRHYNGGSISKCACFSTTTTLSGGNWASCNGFCNIAQTGTAITLSDCLSVGALSAASTTDRGIGGFVGRADSPASGIDQIIRCYADVAITTDYSKSIIGAFLGWDLESRTKECYFNSDTYATDRNSPETVGLTSEEMKDSSNFDGFNFTTTWMMLSKTDIEAVCGAGYGTPAYDALPANLKDKPWLRSLSDVIIEGIEPECAANPLFMFAGL